MRCEALRLVGEILDDPRRLQACGLEWRVEVSDESEIILFRLDVSIMAPTAMARARLKHPNEV